MLRRGKCSAGKRARRTLEARENRPPVYRKTDNLHISGHYSAQVPALNYPKLQLCLKMVENTRFLQILHLQKQAWCVTIIAGKLNITHCDSVSSLSCSNSGRHGDEEIRLESGTYQHCKREILPGRRWRSNVSSSLGRPEKAGRDRRGPVPPIASQKTDFVCHFTHLGERMRL